MKTRVISAFVGIAVLCVAIALYDTAALPVFVLALAVIAACEMLHACGCLGALDFCAYTVLAAGFAACAPGKYLTAEALAAAVILLLILWLRWHGRHQAQQLGFAFGASVLIALSFRCVLMMRSAFGHDTGLYALMVTLVAAWMSDTGAYFAGHFFGKTKLCPHISPHKTVEGVVGGVLGAIVGQLVLALVFEHLCGLHIRVGLLCMLSPVLTTLSIVGDLSASVIKRDTGIKDYGNIMPGHGGVLDRFDSVLPLLPVVYMLFSHFAVVQ